MRKSDGTRILDMLSDGRWHAVEDMADTICIDYRARIFELRRAGHPLDSRMMTRTRPDGSLRRSKDWRDIAAVDALRDSVRASVESAQTYTLDNRNRVTLDTAAGGVTVMCGRLRLLTVDAMADEIMRGLGIG